MKPYIDAEFIPTACILLDGLLIKKRRGEILTTFERRIVVDLIEALPFDEGLNFCGACAARDVSRKALSGRSLCRKHALEELGEGPVTTPQGADRPLTPRTQVATQDMEVQFVEALLAQKHMGKPISVTDKARAHLVIDSRPFGQGQPCLACDAEGGRGFVCEGFDLCAEHLHEAIEAPPVMT